MVIVLKNDATESEKQSIKSVLNSKKFKINEVAFLEIMFVITPIKIAKTIGIPKNFFII